MIQGVVAPGKDLGNPNLPFFHLTDHGRKVVLQGEYLPHDPTGYLDRFRKEVTNVDPVVMAYLSESLECFARGNLIACTVMLGVASERVFLLLCDALNSALTDAKERTEFEKICERIAMKPKMDWVLYRIQRIQSGSPRPLPDNVNIALLTVFDFVRCQRNDLGHPQDTPPKVSREDAYVNLRVFPSYCAMTNQVVEYLRTHNV